MTTLTLARRCAIASCCCAWIVASAALHAAPVLYANGTDGFDPNLPARHQHHSWGKDALANNNWQRTGGWCFHIAYADFFYDLTKRGYFDLPPADEMVRHRVQACWAAPTDDAEDGERVSAQMHRPSPYFLSGICAAVPRSCPTGRRKSPSALVGIRRSRASGITSVANPSRSRSLMK